GDIALSADALPPGVTCKPQTINPASPTGHLVLSAAPDAAPWVGEIKVKGTATINGQPVVREARSASITWANPGQQAATTPTFTRLDRGVTIAVREKAPFGLSAEAEKTTIMQGDKLNVKLKLQRQWPDFKVPLQVAISAPTGMGKQQQQQQNQPI